MASIKKGDWRLKELPDKGASLPRLITEEYKLWKQIKKIADNAKKQPKICKFFPDSKLIGYGWEWAVYELPRKEVVKVPAGIFKEVNEPEYIENTEFTYEVIRKHLREFVVETTFERIRFNHQELNTLRQRRIQGDEVTFVIPRKLPFDLRKNLSEYARGMLDILEKHEWIPDMHLWRKRKGGKDGWNIWNLIIENNKPLLFDFSAYYDVWRLYPQRTEKEKKIKGRRWQDFLKDLNL